MIKKIVQSFDWILTSSVLPAPKKLTEPHIDDEIVFTDGESLYLGYYGTFNYWFSPGEKKPGFYPVDDWNDEFRYAGPVGVTDVIAWCPAKDIISAVGILGLDTGEVELKNKGVSFSDNNDEKACIKKILKAAIKHTHERVSTGIFDEDIEWFVEELKSSGYGIVKIGKNKI